MPDPGRVSLSMRRAARGLVRGMRFFLEQRPPEVNQTPRTEVLRQGKLSVARFEGGSRVHPLPVLLVPPLMVKPYIFDLRPGHSLAAYLLEQGFDVFLVDFGVPDRADQHVRIEDYVFEDLPRAIAAACQATGRDRVVLVGYCMGGLFSLLYAAGQPERLAGLVLVACPVDFGKMGLISLVVQHAHRQMEALIDRLGNVPGLLPSVAMRLTNPAATLAGYADLFLRAWDEEYVKGFASMNAWLNDFIPGPGEAYKEYIRDFLVGNELVGGRVRLGQRELNVARVECPVLSIAGTRDPIATVESARAILDVVGSPNKEFCAMPGGHVGVLAGGRAPLTTWPKIAAWLASILPAPTPADPARR
ncbi:MAG TPA: alpha/beta fold hydrolase [Candidatus Nitrosotenuis sp.]|nr:alpha/beta fold hydrolase [Candidatus Nitrosotenuis sp.]